MKGAWVPPLVVLGMSIPTAGALEHDWQDVQGGMFHSALLLEDPGRPVRVPSFSMTTRPISHAQFSQFLGQSPQWQRDRVPALFASPGYLRKWVDGATPGEVLDPNAPVVDVTWHAASAYCRWTGGRLPTFLEWEYASAADATQPDARGQSRWRAAVAHDGTAHAQDAKHDIPNAYGLYQLHGATWEWVEDFSSLLGQGDRRGQDDGQALRYCGAAALSFEDAGNYAVVKRFVLLSALNAHSTLGNLGFRCARSAS